MTRLSSLRLPSPSNWQDFESLCCDLWRVIWKDPNTQKNGRQGQPQQGVDIFGRPDQKSWLAGVQCKGKDNYDDKSLTEDEVEAEVEKAKSFTPSLKYFTIATSGKRDAKIQQLARNITEKHLSAGLFTVHVWSWEDILSHLEEHPDIVDKYYEGLGLNSKTTDIDELKETTQKILEDTGKIKSNFISQMNIKTPGISSYVDISANILIPEYQAEIDHSRDLLKNYSAVEAISYLEMLKSRIWANSPSIVKYRILTNIGAAKNLLNEHQEGAKLLIEALQYNQNDEKALCNAALGYILLGMTDLAVSCANQILELNPSSSKAYSILIRAASDDELAEDVIARIPEPFRTAPEVANAISFLFHKRGNNTEATKWLEIAVNNDTANSPELKAALGIILIKVVTDDQSSLFGIQINEARRDQLKRAVELLTMAWNRVANTSIHQSRADWIANRGLAKRLLSDLDGAIGDVRTAIAAVPTDPIFKKYLAMLFHEKNENQKAIDLLKNIIETGTFPDALFLLGEILREENKVPEAIEIVNKLLEGDCDKLIREESQRLLIRLYIDASDLPSAKNALSPLLSEDPNNILYLVDASRIAKNSGERDEAFSFLIQAKSQINASTTHRQLLEIADGFYDIEEFEEALLMYERIVDKALNTPLSRRLLNSYFRAGMLDKALDICQVLYQKFGPAEYIAEMESAIYEEIGNLVKAKEICRSYLDLYPDDYKMQLRLAVINLRSNDLAELDKFLDSAPEIHTLSLENGLQYASLLAIRNRGQKAFSVIYDLRRTFFNNPDAHLKYMGIFLQRENDTSDWLNVTKVEVDVAVCVEEEGHGKEWYLIEDRKDANISRREFNLNHPLVNKMLGKSIGDDIVLIDSPYSKISGKIVEIKSKYVYAFQDSLASFETLFPGATGVWKVNVRTPQNSGTPEAFQKVLDEVSRQHSRGLQVEKFYKEGKLTIGTFANLVGRDLLQVWNWLISNIEPGVFCCIGSFEERNYADSIITNGVKLIADPIALMTIHSIDIADFIVNRYGKIGVAQSTINLFSDIVNERKGIQSKGFMVIGKVGDGFVRHEISPEDIKQNLEYLEKVLNWTNINCEVVPCKAALTMKRDQRRQLEKMIGSSSIETVLIASEPGTVLFTDDEPLRVLAKREFNANGVWTQVLLMKSLNDGTLDRGKYNECVIQLINLNYRHTIIDALNLVEAAKHSGWAPKPPYTTVLRILGGQYSNENSALIVGANFLYELFKQTMLTQQRDQLILALLDTITSKRNPRIVIGKLKKLLERRFYIIPLSLGQVFSIIDSWQMVHIV